jgi:ABC-type Fe3+/spermidine/putrescine transport system ATPase subunit
VNVTKRFGKVLALDRVTFDVQDGEYLCVLGPTGSGKTTLLRLIAGLLKPEEGTIYFDDRPVTNIDPQDRNSVFVPQQYALFPHLTVLQNVAFGPLAKGRQETEALETAKKTLELVRLSARSDALPSELSGGMQQRVALARGLASGARLLLLDEPLGALDARLRLELRHKLRELVKQAGMTAIHVTHDRDEAMSVADHVMVLRNGRILDYGTADRVYMRPQGIFVANLIGGASFLEGTVQASIGNTVTVRVRGGVAIKTQEQEPFTAGEPIILGIRKERVRIQADDLNLANVLNGEIRAVRFLGNSREYLIRLTNGDTITARRFLEGPEPDFKVGMNVSVCFEERDVMTFQYPVGGMGKELEMV